MLVQGALLEVKVISYENLKIREGTSTSTIDPFICLEYGSSKRSGSMHTGKNLIFLLEENCEELIMFVNSSDALDDNKVKGSIHLQKVLAQGYDEVTCRIYSEFGSPLGDIHLILQCHSNPKHLTTTDFSTSLLPNMNCLPLAHANYQPIPVDSHANTHHHHRSDCSASYQPGTTSNITCSSRGLKRTLCESYRSNEGGDFTTLTRRRVAEGTTWDDTLEVPEQIMEIEVDQLLEGAPTTFEEDCSIYGTDREMMDVNNSHNTAPQPYNGLWDTISF